MEIIDNINKTLKEDITTTLRSGSKVSIAASSFSIYAFQELKEQLGDISELRFIFTSFPGVSKVNVSSYFFTSYFRN